MPEPIPIKDHEQETRLVNKRLMACALFVAAITCALVVRLYVLQVLEFDYNSTISENNRVHVLPITPPRGLIYDRNGVVLADNRPSFNLTITRERASDIKGELDEVVNLLHLPAEDRTLFDKAMKQARHPFVPVTLFYELSEEQIAVLAVNEFRLPGIDVQPQFVRHYLMGAHFAHSIGYVGRINEKESKVLDSVEYRGTQSIGKTGHREILRVAIARPRRLRRSRNQRPGPGAARAQAHRSDPRQKHRPEPRRQTPGSRRGSVG